MTARAAPRLLPLLALCLPLLALSLLASCRSCTGDGAATGGGPAAASRDGASARGDDASAQGVRAVAGDGGSRSTATNLLYTTSAVVAVSSKVDNPRDFPEHLIDGKAETAWNGKTGDLVGGWMAFRVPAEARVTSIALTAGFDKRGPTDDLFTANHRIKRVRVSRAGVTLREATLDPDKRGPQPIAVDAPGGDFRIEVLEVAPGTKASWRELVVSELAVYGEPGAARVPPHLPHVLVGSLDAPAKVPAKPSAPADASGVKVRGPFASIDAFCKDHGAAVAPRFAAGKDEYPGFIEPPYCVRGDPMADGQLAPPLVDLRSVLVTEWSTRERDVVIVTARGAFVVDFAIDVEEIRNPGCGGACGHGLEKVDVVRRKDGGATVVVVSNHHCWSNPFPVYDDDGGVDHVTGSSQYDKRALVCVVRPEGAVECRKQAIATRAAAYLEFEDRWADVPWDDVKKRTTTPDGDVLFQ
ncbi:MAG: hypothetical protein JNL38_09720 [Myxococcales bacterium]|nr:hypothetical protein [Myxococcales bacterium]